MEDQGIIALFFDRSEQAIVETDKKYGRYCYSIAYNILSNREDSEESVSDTYLEAWNTIPPRHPGFLNAFLAKITRHISIDRWRKRSAKKTWRRGNHSGAGGTGRLRRRARCRNGILQKRINKGSQSIPVVVAGDRAECVSVPVLVSGFHPNHFRGYGLHPEQGNLHAPQNQGKLRKKLSEEEAMAARDSYKRMELDWKPFPQFPFE